MPAHRLLFLFMSRAICSAPSMMSFAALLPPMWCICRLDTFTDATSDLIVSTFGISTKKICFSLCYGRAVVAGWPLTMELPISISYIALTVNPAALSDTDVSACTHVPS